MATTEETATTAGTSIIERVQDFVSENRRAVIIGTTAVVIGGAAAAYYVASSSAPLLSSTPRSRRTDAEKAERKAAKEKEREKKKSKKSVKDSDGPILEEVPKELSDEEKNVEVMLALPAEEIAALPAETRDKLAVALKIKGNTAYQTRAFNQAVDFYTLAIQISPKPVPVYYSNRAACYMAMTPPQLEDVVEDCNAALDHDSRYIKALNRRATAYEQLKKYEEALRDFTAATIIDEFKTKTTSESVERVVKTMTKEKAAQMLETREPRLPSTTFISAYFAAFRPRPLLTLPVNASTGDQTLLQGLEALESADYTRAASLINESIEQGISWDIGRAEALNLRGTFKFLTGDIEGAKADLSESIALVPSFTQSLVKIASVFMEQSNAEEAFECFEKAIRYNPNDPDIYYHRGQVRFIMNDFTLAAEDYTKSSELDDQFVFSHIQLAVAQYKSGTVTQSMQKFRETLKAFPHRTEPHNYYGELLLDQSRFKDAVEKFDRAIELEKQKTGPGPRNVLPLVNKGLALYQWHQDVASAEACCREALEIDPECEAAVGTLAQLSLQQNRMDIAVQMFERQVELARSEPELMNALTYKYATGAQLEFAKNYPDLAARLGHMARNMPAEG